MKRLIVKSKLYDGFKWETIYENLYIEVFINPTIDEIEMCRDANKYNSVRGVIYDDGTVLAWRGDVIHDDINKRSNLMIDIDTFRFANDNDYSWVIDVNKKHTLEETIDLIFKYKDKLSNIGSLNIEFQIYFAKNNVTCRAVKINFDDNSYEYNRKRYYLNQD